MGQTDVAVLGGGIMGLAVARELRARGLSVAVVERSSCGAESSGAAAGILSTLTEVPHGERLWPLVERAAALHEDWCAAIGAEGGVSVGFERHGLLALALGPTEEEGLSELMVKAARLGARVAKISGDDARRLVPELGRGVVSALHAPRDAQVDPRALVRALEQSCRKAGVDVRVGTGASSVERTGAGFSFGVRDLTARRILVALGAWSSDLGIPPLPAGSIAPCRGQILVFGRGRETAGPVLYRPGHGYVLLRGPHALAGSTLEPGASRKALTAGGLGAITKNALALLPALAEAELLDSWAGLRPQTADGLPVMGRGDEGIYFCTGHFKSGILLAPAVAEAMADLVTGRAGSVSLQAFGPERFAVA